MAETEDMTVVQEDLVVLEWREEQFRLLGFKTREARNLANSRVELGRMRTLIDQGCDKVIAARILEGTDQLGRDESEVMYFVN